MWRVTRVAASSEMGVTCVCSSDLQAAAWLAAATGEAHYRTDFERAMLLRDAGGGQKWWYEGYAASWDDLTALANLRMATAQVRPFYARDL